jgi:hypothetical protein
MTPRCVLEAINLYLQDIHNCEQIWGGKIMILAGDRRQTTPVLRGGSTEALIDITIHQSPLLANIVPRRLYKNERIGEDQKPHREWVQQVGDGRVDNQTDRSVKIPLHLCLKEGETISTHVYPANTIFHDDNNKKDELLDTFFAERAILCPTNEIALEANNSILDRVPGDAIVFESNDCILTEGLKEQVSEEIELRYPVEYLYKQTPSGLPPHSLTLKPGVIIILLRNIRVKDGLCNGTRLRFISYHHEKFLLKCRILTGPHQGKIEYIPRMDIDSSPSTGFPFVLRRRQFPVRLAFAMTINKSQGQTFRVCGVFLPTQCFAHGQLCVTVSRCQTAENLRIDSYDKENRRCDEAVNVVIPQILG